MIPSAPAGQEGFGTSEAPPVPLAGLRGRWGEGPWKRLHSPRAWRDVRHHRRRLVQELWPDKLLYGTIVLVVTGLVSLLYTGFAVASDVDYGGAVPRELEDFPPSATAGLSVLAMALGAAGWLWRNTNLSLPGAAAGVLSLGLLGLASVLGVLAAVLFVLARLEGEDTHHPSLGLTRHHWPDKSLAASALLVINGLATTGWGLIIALDGVSVAMDNPQGVGLGLALLGAFMLGCARMLHYQKAPVAGVGAAIGGVFGLAFFIVGPLLGLGTLLLLALAQGEREFHPAGGAARG